MSELNLLCFAHYYGRLLLHSHIMRCNTSFTKSEHTIQKDVAFSFPVFPVSERDAWDHDTPFGDQERLAFYDPGFHKEVHYQGAVQTTTIEMLQIDFLSMERVWNMHILKLFNIFQSLIFPSFRAKIEFGHTGASNDVRRSNTPVIHQFCCANVTVLTELLGHNQFAHRLDIETLTIIQGLPVRLENTLL